MMKTVRASVAALAFAGLVAQPIAANAHFCYPPPPCHTAAGSAFPAWGIAWAFGFFLCAGMMEGAQDHQARIHHTTVSGHDRWAGMAACILPPIGLAKLDKMSKKYG